jgi:hypothetical protein
MGNLIAHNRLLVRIVIMLLAGAATGRAMALTVLPMPVTAGAWQGYVDIGTGSHGTFDTEYLGGADNFGPLPIDPNLGPSVPGGLARNMAAFVDVSKGTLGVSGFNTPGVTFLTSGFARFQMNLAFTGSGVATLGVSFRGKVNGSDLTAGSAAYLREYLQVNDLTAGTTSLHRDAICTVRTFDCASVTNVVSETLQSVIDVTPGHVYQMTVDEAGVAIGEGMAFDGIDPSAISVTLSPGVTLNPVNGLALPGFLAPATASVPEPDTVLLSVGLFVALVGAKRIRLRRARKLI